MRPTLRQLEYLVSVADHQHFGRAAEACGVTQPGLSLQLKRLEQTLGHSLFERRPRAILPTRTGEQVISRARRILSEVDELVERAQAAGGALTGPVHLGVIPTVAPFLLPRILPAVQKAFPRLRPFLHEEKTLALIDGLLAGRLELALLALPLPLPRPDEHLETRRLLDEPFLLAVPADHRLSQRKRVSQSDLLEEEVLLLEEGHCFRDQALAICTRAGARERADFRAASLGTLVQMVRSGVGVTLLPAMAAQAKVPGNSSLRLLPFRGQEGEPAPRRTIGLAWRKSSPHANEFEGLSKVIRRAQP